MKAAEPSPKTGEITLFYVDERPLNFIGAEITSTITQTVAEFVGEKVAVGEIAPDRPRMIWSGNGGSMGLGHITLTDSVVAKLRSNRTDEALNEYLSADGQMDTCIVLRTGLLKDGVLHVQAGAGIVADSAPDMEQAECRAKAEALFRAAEEAVRLAGSRRRRG